MIFTGMWRAIASGGDLAVLHGPICGARRRDQKWTGSGGLGFGLSVSFRRQLGGCSYFSYASRTRTLRQRSAEIMESL